MFRQEGEFQAGKSRVRFWFARSCSPTDRLPTRVGTPVAPCLLSNRGLTGMRTSRPTVGRSRLGPVPGSLSYQTTRVPVSAAVQLRVLGFIVRAVVAPLAGREFDAVDEFYVGAVIEFVSLARGRVANQKPDRAAVFDR